MAYKSKEKGRQNKKDYYHWILENLQPLEKIENIKKRNHYIG